MTVSETIKKQIGEALTKLGLLEVPAPSEVEVELAKDMAHGDYASNVALILGKQLGKDPKELAEQICKEIGSDAQGYIERCEVAGAGFINFWLSEKFYADTLKDALGENPTSPRLRGARFGWASELRGKKVMIEFSQANPFKQLHIGHFVGTVLGECYARLHEASGASVLRANYQGDVGVHVACSLYGMREMRETLPNEGAELTEKTEFLGKAYAFGAKQYKESPDIKSEIDEINKKLYQKSDQELNELYEMGKRWSLAHFDTIYKRLGTRFDHLFFESEMAPKGLEVIAAHREVFEDSEGAVVFHAEKYGLHTRVFISSAGLPVYEAKELGLNKHKFDVAPLDLSIVDTGNEINDYFKVLMKVMELTIPEVAKRTKHVSHGMLRLSTGKMSSRTGNVITGESVMNDAVANLPPSEISLEDKDVIAIGAIKYSILKQAPGRDIIFDMEKSLSLEGDSGPYIQYAYTRAQSVLLKAQAPKFKVQTNPNLQNLNDSEKKLMRLIGRFPEIVNEAQKLLAPQVVCTYLIELAGEFHHFYATTRIADPSTELGAGANVGEIRTRRLALTAALAQTIQNGLWILGIGTVDKM
ncbi:MAG TPA: arginine--tRNA ligase [Candidatus Paceibacterota bacterium]